VPTVTFPLLSGLFRDLLGTIRAHHGVPVAPKKFWSDMPLSGTVNLLADKGVRGGTVNLVGLPGSWDDRRVGLGGGGLG
jgi:hypothetical protein